jgi:hypothetical protein
MKRQTLAILSVVAMLAACSDADQNPTSSSVEKAPQVDTDPTPDTGTGGESQSVSPDGTVNGAPPPPAP